MVEEVCCAGKFIGFLKIRADVAFEQRVLRRPPLEACLYFFSRGLQVFVSEVAVNFVHPLLFFSSVSNIHNDVW